jgi:hypothetical protein
VAVPAGTLATHAGLYRSTRDHNALRLAVVNGALATDAAGAATLVARSTTSFAMGRSRIDFDAAGTGRTGFRMTGTDGDVVRWEPVEEFAPTAQQLAEYAGSYRSDEAEATYTISVEGDHLVLLRRFGGRDELRLLYRDVFEGGGARFRFVRDDAGRIAQLSAIADRVWDLRFRRLPAGTD